MRMARYILLGWRNMLQHEGFWMLLCTLLELSTRLIWNVSPSFGPGTCAYTHTYTKLCKWWILEGHLVGVRPALFHMHWYLIFATILGIAHLIFGWIAYTERFRNDLSTLGDSTAQPPRWGVTHLQCKAHWSWPVQAQLFVEQATIPPCPAPGTHALTRKMTAGPHHLCWLTWDRLVAV